MLEDEEEDDVLAFRRLLEVGWNKAAVAVAKKARTEAVTSSVGISAVSPLAPAASLLAAVAAPAVSVASTPLPVAPPAPAAAAPIAVASPLAVAASPPVAAASPPPGPVDVEADATAGQGAAEVPQAAAESDEFDWAAVEAAYVDDDDEAADGAAGGEVVAAASSPAEGAAVPEGSPAEEVGAAPSPEIPFVELLDDGATPEAEEADVDLKGAEVPAEEPVDGAAIELVVDAEVETRAEAEAEAEPEAEAEVEATSAMRGAEFFEALEDLPGEVDLVEASPEAVPEALEEQPLDVDGEEAAPEAVPEASEEQPIDVDDEEAAPEAPIPLFAPRAKWSGAPPPAKASSPGPMAVKSRMPLTAGAKWGAPHPGAAKSPSSAGGSHVFVPPSAKGKGAVAPPAKLGGPGQGGRNGGKGGPLPLQAKGASGNVAQRLNGGANGKAVPGYIFVCNGSTQPECESRQLFASPDRELSQMKSFIKPETHLYLFNFSTNALKGPYVMVSSPDRNIVPGAFGGRFSAQVRVRPLASPAREVRLERRIPGGAKTAAEMSALGLHMPAGMPAPTAKPPAKAWAATNRGPVVGQQPLAKRAMHDVPSAQPPAKVAKKDQTACDAEGRRYNLRDIVVNFANVGATYAERVLGRKSGRDRMFDWEGVRKCVKCLTEELGLQVAGVCFENFCGPDNGVKRDTIPDDIKKMCDSIEETPQVAGRNHRSADDEMTIKCAYRRNCRFMDNDNYREWLKEMSNAKVRAWLNQNQELMQMRYFFDSELGTFDTLEGNVPAGLLAQGPQ